MHDTPRSTVVARLRAHDRRWPQQGRSVAVALAALAAVAALEGCGPSVDAAAKADVDGRVAALRPSGNTFPAPGGFVPMPLAVGQWTQYKMVDDKNQPSFLTQKIIGEESGAYWLETVHESYSGRTVTKLLAAFGSRTDPGQLEIRAAATKDSNGHVNEVPREMMPMMQSLYKSALSMLFITWQGQPQEPATVPAGKFEGCFKARTEAKWGPFGSLSDSWSHPSVPLSGMVRSQGIDKPLTMELVAFGTTGATSAF